MVTARADHHFSDRNPPRARNARARRHSVAIRWDCQRCRSALFCLQYTLAHRRPTQAGTAKARERRTSRRRCREALDPRVFFRDTSALDQRRSGRLLWLERKRKGRRRSPRRTASGHDCHRQAGLPASRRTVARMRATASVDSISPSTRQIRFARTSTTATASFFYYLPASTVLVEVAVCPGPLMAANARCSLSKDNAALTVEGFDSGLRKSTEIVGSSRMAVGTSGICDTSQPAAQRVIVAPTWMTRARATNHTR